MSTGQSKKGPPVVLAVQILAITAGSGSTQQQRGFAGLPPTAFARIIAWSHGQLSIETSEFSECGKAKPAFLPLGKANTDGIVERNEDASIELEVSLWDKRQTEASNGEFSRVMLDASAEVILPAPGKLGKSKGQATMK